MTTIALAVALFSNASTSEAGESPQEEQEAEDPQAESTTSQTEAPSASPEADPEEERYAIAETFTAGNVTMTVHSIEPVEFVETTEGGPITPSEGGQLFLMRSTYENSRIQADLSCGDSGLYLQMVDTEEREISQVFETRRIPGNPGCSENLIQDPPHEWNLVFQGAEGVSPLGMVVNETSSRPEPVIVMFQ